MSSEADLQKLKVTDLKELLAKHALPQTGKKDDLIKRLLDNKISADGGEEELTDPEPLAPPETSSAPAQPPTTDAAPSDTTSTLTPEQQALKARAERFGLAFNPNPPSKPAPKPVSTPAEAEPKPAPTKAGAIDKAPLGISEETLAKRREKFGVVEKTTVASTTKAAAASNGKKEATVVAKAPAPELTPEMAEKQAIEDEKKRKRAEKFGTAKPATNGSEAEPETKKAKA
ncbi:hypothetical protein BCR39DRAFT_520310 [Naematelia encephala]|uniref:SAP domain-containing protein n=1 Tax=Naematelia encephala TaxID=71784 RepID=A0A1Y2BG51_9TREE|nr:hypothetical protein BCR39DRAFT_520310 [Naematelia encephala]